LRDHERVARLVTGGDTLLVVWLGARPGNGVLRLRRSCLNCKRKYHTAAQNLGDCHFRSPASVKNSNVSTCGRNLIVLRTHPESKRTHSRIRVQLQPVS
jgi:hypothetical protein